MSGSLSSSGIKKKSVYFDTGEKIMDLNMFTSNFSREEYYFSYFNPKYGVMCINEYTQCNVSMRQCSCLWKLQFPIYWSSLKEKKFF